MRASRTLLISTWAAMAAAALAPSARAAAGEEPDDPKMARRLGTREAVSPPAPVASPPPRGAVAPSPHAPPSPEAAPSGPSL